MISLPLQRRPESIVAFAQATRVTSSRASLSGPPVTRSTSERAVEAQECESEGRDPIQVFVLEDNLGLRKTLSAVVDAMPDMQICGAAESAEDALLKLQAIPCDVVLVDLSLPGMDGIEFIARASRSGKTKFLVLTGHRSPRLATLVTEAGGHGFLLKDGPAEVFAAIRKVVRATTDRR